MSVFHVVQVGRRCRDGRTPESDKPLFTLNLNPCYPSEHAFAVGPQKPSKEGSPLGFLG
jgi:hypothetical protein